MVLQIVSLNELPEQEGGDGPGNSREEQVGTHGEALVLRGDRVDQHSDSGGAPALSEEILEEKCNHRYYEALLVEGAEGDGGATQDTSNTIKGNETNINLTCTLRL